MKSYTTRGLLAAAIMAPLFGPLAACGGANSSTQEVASAPERSTAAKPRSVGVPSGAPEEGKGAFYDATLAYVRCMRTRGGVPEFPDPKLSGHLDWTKISALQERDVAAGGSGALGKGGDNQECVTELQRSMQLEPKRDAQNDFESMLAHAQCMRSHGVSKFANPTMSGGNVLPGGDPNPTGQSFDTNSPTYEQARKACADKLLDGLDGVQ